MQRRIVPISDFRSTQKERRPAITKAVTRLLKRCGWSEAIPPVLVTSYKGKEEIHDGHHRVDAARAAGITHVPVIDIGSMSAQDRAAHSRRIKKFRQMIKHPLAACPLPRKQAR